MVGLVLVSHNRALAEAACLLAKNVGHKELPIAFAGGAGEDHAELGTDATDIMDAISQVYSGDGVLVLMDLGSAIISARLAQQMLEDSMPDIRLCPAPLVEGAVAAAVQIGAGATLDAVYAEAKAALDAKTQELEPEAAATQQAPAAGEAAIPKDALQYRFIMDEPNGMHTRPAAELVKTLSGFKASVMLRNVTTPTSFVSARSLNKIALSNIQQGDVVEVAIWGDDASQALNALRELVHSIYHSSEPDGPPAAPAKEAPREEAPQGLVGISPGIALGTLYTEERAFPPLQPQHVADIEAECARLDAAVATVHQRIEEQKKHLTDTNQAAIIEAQLYILDDAETLSEVKVAIRNNGCDAASAYQEKMLSVAKGLRALPNEYMQQRAGDVEGVAEQVLYTLAGKTPPDVSTLMDVVIYAREVSPTFVSRWKEGQLKGILTERGGKTSHVAILAKAMNIPAIMGCQLPEGIGTGTSVALDAGKPEIIFSPSPEQASTFTTRLHAWEKELARDAADSQGQAVSTDGVHVPVFANIGDEETAAAAAKGGAEGVGLLRTEFLFMNRRTAPDEQEQVSQLGKLFAYFSGKPITVRTLDIGGDKSAPWLQMPEESNPFLGVRGVRLCERKPDIFMTQLRSILRAGKGYDIHVMVPMISVREEITFAHKALEQAHNALVAENLEHCWPVTFGIMIETPAAVMQAAELAAMVDFFSIGTNDLTQYIMSAERGSKDLASLADPMHPAVLRAIGMVAAGAAQHGTDVAVCGEMAGDPIAAQALLGLGVNHLSMNAPSIGRIKRMIRTHSIKELAVLAENAKQCPDAHQARKLFSLES